MSTQLYLTYQQGHHLVGLEGEVWVSFGLFGGFGVVCLDEYLMKQGCLKAAQQKSA